MILFMKTKDYWKKYPHVVDGIKNKIKTINGGKGYDNEKDYMKIKFNSDDNLPLNKPLKFHAVTIIIRSVFEEDGQLYPRFFLKALCMNYRNSISGGIDTIKTSASKECMLCHYWYFKDVQFRFEPYVCNKCDNVLMTAYELKSVAV